jgi:hypothetical protein
MPNEEKRCWRCKVSKPRGDFTRNRSALDGLESACKACRKAIRAAYAQSEHGRQVHREKERRNRRTEKGRARYMRTHERNRASGKIQARSAVGAAVKKGILQRISSLSCCRCGLQARHYHHHNGHKPEHYLDVIPVCALCHKQAEK